MTTRYPAKELRSIKKVLALQEPEETPVAEPDIQAIVDYVEANKPRRQQAYDHPVITKAGKLYRGVPVLLGYLEVAAKIPKQVPVRDEATGVVTWHQVYNEDGSIAHVGDSAVRNYLYKDIKLGEPNLMPRPDALLVRGDTILPGWYEETIDEWLRTGRSGLGNHTSGKTRRGNTKGRIPRAALSVEN